MIPIRIVLVLTPLVLGLGCAGFQARNVPLTAWNPQSGYRPEALQKDDGQGSILLLLAFSGGGTRAATLSYGVLQELRDTWVVVGGERKRLLDEVDLISSVSGGSFTAAYYGLYGDRIFEDFESRFLRHDIERDLIWILLNPLNWIRMLNPFVSRTDLGIDLYDRRVFGGATFTDLARAGGPFVQINAADLASGSRFTFYQPQFDLICSDLSPFLVARAVAASSAVPVAFESITLRNYAGSCGFEAPEWIQRSLAEPRSSRRRYALAKLGAGYLDAKERPYVHLVDGGVADNSGLRAPLEIVELMRGVARRMEQIGASVLDHLVVIVVDAQVNPKPGFSLRPDAPSLRELVSAITESQINRSTFETIELMRARLETWAQQLPVGDDGLPTRTYMVEVAFDLLGDSEERAYFNALPTSFDLADEEVDRLLEVGRRLLRESPDYQRLLRAVGGSE